MLYYKRKDKEEYKMKSHSKETDYGFNQKEINIQDWVFKQLDKERGGIEFMLPNAQGEIYLTWGDMYSVDVTFVNTQAQYKEVVTLPTLEVLLETLEEQRKKTVGSIRDMLMDKFGSDKERKDGKPF